MPEDTKIDTSIYTIPCKGIIAHSQHEWEWAELLTREPKEDEFLVEMIATGVCHTDISGYGGIYPRILGHEGMYLTLGRMHLNMKAHNNHTCSWKGIST